MARTTPAEYAEKWKRRLSGSTEDIRRGIDRVTVAPGERAAAAQDAMLQNITEAVASGRWANRTRAVTLQEWKTAARDKGVGRIASGTQAAESKMAAVAQQLLPAVDAAAAAARAIPKVTIEDSINRAATFMRQMREFKNRR